MKFFHVIKKTYHKKFSREAVFVTIKSLLFLFFLILFFSNFQKNFSQEKISTNTKIPQFYLENSKQYLNNNNFFMANYLNIAGLSEFPENIELLKQKDLIYLKQNEKMFVEKDLNAWLYTAAIHPDYRDAYARVAFLYLKLGDKINAEKYLQIVRSIDPNWSPLSKFSF